MTVVFQISDQCHVRLLHFLEMATLSRSAKIPRERLLLFKRRRHSSTNRHTRANTPTVLSLDSEIVF